MLFISLSYGLGDFQFSNMLDSWRATSAVTGCSICVCSCIPSYLGEDCKDDLLVRLSSFFDYCRGYGKIANKTNCRTRKNWRHHRLPWSSWRSIIQTCRWPYDYYVHKPCAIKHPPVVQPVVFGWQIGVAPLLSNHTKCGGTVTWSKQPCIFNDVGLLALCALVEGYPTSQKAREFGCLWF